VMNGEAYQNATVQFDFALAHYNGKNPETDPKASYLWFRLAQCKCEEISRRSAAQAELFKTKLNQDEIAILDGRVREEIRQSKEQMDDVRLHKSEALIA